MVDHRRGTLSDNLVKLFGVEVGHSNRSGQPHLQSLLHAFPRLEVGVFLPGARYSSQVKEVDGHWIVSIDQTIWKVDECQVYKVEAQIFE